MSPRDWKKSNQNQITFRLPTDLSKEKLDLEAKNRNLEDRTKLIINALYAFLAPPKEESQEISPSLQTANSLLQKMIPAFIEAGIKLKLTNEEQELVKTIYKEVSQ